jgi:hypothetical protein
MGDWYPASREGQLHWVKNLNGVLATRATDWNIPRPTAMQLVADALASEEILDKVKSAERTPVDTVQCNAVFGDMEAEARFVKRHFLLSPPLTAADLASVLLDAPGNRSPIGVPTGQPLVTVSYPGGPHVHMVRFSPLPGTEPFDPRSDYGYALYCGIMPPGGATLEQAASAKHYLMRVPLDGGELLHYRFTRRSKERVEFAGTEAGMIAYYCARYENPSGDAGEWGPIVLAVIT